MRTALFATPFERFSMTDLNIPALVRMRDMCALRPRWVEPDLDTYLVPPKRPGKVTERDMNKAYHKFWGY